jgi:hypothetical protein
MRTLCKVKAKGVPDRRSRVNADLREEAGDKLTVFARF